MRFFICISYKGAAYSGWQIQKNAPSIQQKLEEALSIVFSQSVSVTGCGRTDAVVDAIDYFAHFDLSSDVKESKRAVYKLNAILPCDISVSALYRVSDDAHARFDAVRRSYVYRIHTFKDPFCTESYFYKFPVNVETMNEAAKKLIGTQDFSCFEKVGSDNKTSVCTVYEARWREVDDTHFEFEITANRFLRNMVRAIVGTLLEVGRGHKTQEDIDEILKSGDRCKAGGSVPGNALFLNKIEYPYELMKI